MNKYSIIAFFLSLISKNKIFKDFHKSRRDRHVPNYRCHFQHEQTPKITRKPQQWRVKDAALDWTMLKQCASFSSFNSDRLGLSWICLRIISQRDTDTTWQHLLRLRSGHSGWKKEVRGLGAGQCRVNGLTWLSVALGLNNPCVSALVSVSQCPGIRDSQVFTAQI